MEFGGVAAARKGRTLVNDPCLSHGTSCQACLAYAKYCGWCSQKVTYQDGSAGTQCAGTALGIEPFTCDGSYSTSKCPGPSPPPGPTPPTPPSPPHPPTPPSPPVPPSSYKYKCNFTSLKCETGGKQTQQDCSNFCKEPTPVPPAELIGFWRGYQIVNGYKAGEIGIDFEKSVTTKYVDGKAVWTAHVQTYGGVYMRFDIVTGALAGKTFQAEYQKTNINLLMAITLAWSEPDGSMPGSFDEAMKAPEDSDIFYKCADDSVCKFT